MGLKISRDEALEPRPMGRPENQSQRARHLYQRRKRESIPDKKSRGEGKELRTDRGANFDPTLLHG